MARKEARSNYDGSRNCGAESPTDDPQILALCARQQRNFLATLILSQRVPMLLGGDEAGRTQQGNNNAYCQNNEISWYDWDNIDHDHPVFRRRRWFQGRKIHGPEITDIAWFTLEGEQMTEKHWAEGFAKSLWVFLNGKVIPNPNPKGEPVTYENFYLIFNAHHEPLSFMLSDASWGETWGRKLDTARGWVEDEDILMAGDNLQVEGRSMVVLRQTSRAGV